MKKFLIGFFIGTSIYTAFAGHINSPPPLPDEPPAEQAYFQEIYNSLSSLSREDILYKNIQTTDSTVTDIVTIYLSEGESCKVEANILSRKSDGTDRAGYHLEGLFYRNTSGNVTQQGSTVSISSIESNAAWDADLVADTTNQTIDVRITGAAATTITWKSIVKYLKVT